jgi:hypothetical protein
MWSEPLWRLCQAALVSDDNHLKAITGNDISVDERCQITEYTFFETHYTKNGAGVAELTFYDINPRGSILGKGLIPATKSRTGPGLTQFPLQYVLGTKRPQREADYSLKHGSEVKMLGALPPRPLEAFTAWY